MYFLGFRFLLNAAFHALQKFFPDKCNEVRACRDVAELVGNFFDLRRSKKTLAVKCYVFIVMGLKRAGFYHLVYAPQKLKRCACPFSLTVFGQKPRKKGIPCNDFWVALSKVGQNIVDIALKNRVGCNEEYVFWRQITAMLVKQISNALQQDRGFSASCDAIY